MPLTANLLPSTVPPTSFATPFDRATSFAENQAFTASGAINNHNTQIDLGGVAQSPSAGLGSGVGRVSGIWCVNVSTMDFASLDETYRLFLLASNDVAWGNGNVDLLAFHDFASVTAGRIIPTLMGQSLAAPTQLRIPFINLKQGLLYRYLRCNIVITGSTPQATLTSWLSFSREMM